MLNFLSQNVKTSLKTENILKVLYLMKPQNKMFDFLSQNVKTLLKTLNIFLSALYN